MGGVDRLVPTGAAAQPFREMGELFPRWAAQPRKRLALGLASSLHWGAPRQLLAAFRAAHPEVELLFEDVDEIRLREGIDARRIDAGIAPSGAARHGWRRCSLGQERLIVVAPERHAFAAENEIAPAKLRGEIILLAGAGSGDAALRRAITDALGGSPAGFTYQPVQRGTLFDLVALGLGVTISPAAALGAFYPGVCMRAIATDKDQIDCSLMWRADNDRPALGDFLQVAKDFIEAEGGRSAA